MKTTKAYFALSYKMPDGKQYSDIATLSSSYNCMKTMETWTITLFDGKGNNIKCAPAFAELVPSRKKAMEVANLWQECAMEQGNLFSFSDWYANHPVCRPCNHGRDAV